MSLAVLLAGCAQNEPYHTLPGSPGNCRAEPADAACTQSYYQEHEGFDLAFAEFSERGNVFSDRYLTDVLRIIRDKAEQDGVVLVVFIHGWKHNADEDDDNLHDFKRSLRAVGKTLKARFEDNDLGKRQLIGLYIGWRGASINAPVLKQATFWDRKAVAEEVGKGGVTRLLLELDRITEKRDENVMVVIGHSFGGAILVSSLSEVLTERATHRTFANRYARTIGDGLLVLNPAIEANQALAFVEAAIQDHYKPEQHPLFVSLSSDADSATHRLFPLGQTVGLLLTWRQADLERGYYYDRRKPDQALPLKEEHLDATTVGNFAPFLTHRLTATEENGEVKFRYQTCDENPEGCEPAGWTSLSGQPAIRNLPKNFPLYFIKTDESMMSGHNDIFNPRVRSFVVSIVDDVIARSLARFQAKRGIAPPTLPPSILGNPEDFERSLGTFLERVTADR
jgi:hypothetical protein